MERVGGFTEILHHGLEGGGREGRGMEEVAGNRRGTEEVARRRRKWKEQNRLGKALVV